MTSQKQWVKNVFDAAAPEYGKAGSAFFQHFGKTLVEFSRISPGTNVLDVATGRGAVLFPLVDRVGPQGSVIGIDISPNMIAATQQQLDKDNIGRAHVKEMDAEQLDFPDNCFDFVFCGFALFFFPSLSTALAEFKRVLKPGGYLVVSIWGNTPKLDAWVVGEARKLGVDKSLAASPLNDATTLCKTLEEGGFSNIEHKQERKVFWHESSHAWWESLWSHGMRSLFEKLSQTQLNTLHKRALLKAQASCDNDGIPEELHVIFGMGQALGNIVC